MKKIILFAILALSYNAFAQSNHPTLNLKHPAVNSPENIQGIMGKGNWRTSDIFAEINLEVPLNHPILRQDPLSQRYDSIYYWIWSNRWQFDAKTTNMGYDTNNNLTTETYLKWNGSGWRNSYLYTYTYDANNNQTDFITQKWNGSAWELKSQITYAYDGNNNLTSRLYQIWIGNAWKNHWLETNTFDANNNLLSFLFQTWNGSAWKNEYIYTQTFDINNHLTINLQSFWLDNAWSDQEQYTFTYDTNNNLKGALFQYMFGNAWVNSDQTTFTYDENNNRESELYQIWDGGTWVNSGQTTFTYDANNNQISALYQIWNESAWVNSIQTNYTYDANNIKISKSYKQFYHLGTEIEYGDSTFYYFGEVLGVKDMIGSIEGISVYPNPASDQLTITFTLEEPAGVNLEVMNQVGQVVSTILNESMSVGKHQVAWNVGGLPSGIYFYRLKAGNRSSGGKMLVAK